MIGLVGPSCSNDVAEVSRAKSWTDSENFVRDYDFKGFVVSGASTATLVADEDDYPYVARTVTSAGYAATGHLALLQHFGWKRIAVLSDNTAWGTDAGNSFINAHRALYSGDENAGIIDATLFDASAFDAAADDDARLELARGLLNALVEQGARIAYHVITCHLPLTA